MNRKQTIINSVFLSTLIIITLIFTRTSRFQLSIILFLIVCILGILQNKLLIISLYVLFLPIGRLIPTEANILGLFGIDEIINLSTLLIFVFRTNKSNLNKNEMSRLAISLIIIYLFYFNYVNFKNSFFEIYNLSYSLAIKRLIKSLLQYIPLIYLLQLFHIKRYRDATIIGVKICIFLLTITTVFSSYLVEYNLSSSIMDVDTEMGTIARSNGIFSNGDINALGSFFAIAIGFFLSEIEKSRNSTSNILFILLSSIGILFTASRTAIIGLATISVIFLYRNSLKMSGLKYLILLVVSFLILEPFILQVLTRFSNVNVEIKGEEGSRLFKWILYLRYTFDHPKILLWGIDHTFEYRRGVHNLFLEVLFNSGIMIFTIFIYRYFKILSSAIKKVREYNIIYIVIPLFFISMFIGGFEYAVFFYIFLGLSPNFNQISVYDKAKYQTHTYSF